MTSACQPHVCLASASPRRRDLLLSIGVDVDIHPCNVDETPQINESPSDYVVRLAVEKALVADALTPLPTLGSDTAVVLDGKILGKPRNQAHGADMLTALSGRCHEVLTAVALTGPAGLLKCCVKTRVCFDEISDEQIAAYWQTGEPLDKAGGYAAQGLAAVFVTAIEGSYSAVVGLPLYETAKLLRQQGIPLWNNVLR